jgi:hypothetical protein
MVDRAAIFAELTERNALRKAAQLPLIDMQAEYQREVERALYNEWREQHAEVIEQIREEECAKYRKEYGHEPYGMFNGGLAVGTRSEERVHALMEADGVFSPGARHPIIYGSHRKTSGLDLDQ